MNITTAALTDDSKKDIADRLQNTGIDDFRGLTVDEIFNLRELSIKGCERMPEEVEHLNKLVKLQIARCDSLTAIPSSISI